MTERQPTPEEIERVRRFHDRHIDMPKYRELATALHDGLCVLSHTDQCGWVIEEGATFPDTWVDGPTHRHWLRVVWVLGWPVAERIVASLQRIESEGGG